MSNEAKPEKKSKLVELREQLAAQKQKLSNLTPSLKKDLEKAEKERASSIRYVQSKAAKSIKPRDKVKKEAIAAAKERLKNVLSDIHKDYDQIVSDANREREEHVKKVGRGFEAECGMAREKFNECSEAILKEMTQGLKLADETHEKETNEIKTVEMDARRDAIKEIGGLETNIKFEVTQQKKAIDKAC